MIDKREIGQKIKELRLSRDLKQQELAERVGLSRATISNVESGTRGLSLESLHKVCKVFNVSIDYFDIEVESYDEAIDLTARLQRIFASDIVETSVKDELYTSIMEMYLKSKRNL